MAGCLRLRRALCIFERSVGDPAFRHWDVTNKTVEGVPEVELVVRIMPTIGNYDYISDFIFQSRGNIDVRIGASGFVAVRSAKSKNMESPSAKKDTRYGALVAPYTVAPYHDHHINYRLDLDIDGPNNTFVRDFYTLKKLPKKNLRRGVWTLTTLTQKREAAINNIRPAPHSAAWRVENKNKKTPILKNHPSYQLKPWRSTPSILPPNDPAQARAQFTNSTLWMTRFKPRELWASGDYPNLSKPGTGLPVYVANKESIDNKDLVLWYNASFHHITRPEDFLIMPTMWNGFTLRPVHFFDGNKAALQAKSFVK